MTERPLEFGKGAKAELDRVPGFDVGAVPMRAVAHGRDRRLGRADQLGDLGVGQLGMALQQKSDRIRLVLPFGYRSVARALVLEDLRWKGLRGKLEPRLRIGLAALDLLRRGLSVRHRVEPLHLVRHFAIGDGLDFQRMQFAEIGNLVKGERGVFDQPHGGRLGHQRSGHAEFRCNGVRTGFKAVRRHAQKS